VLVDLVSAGSNDQHGFVSMEEVASEGVAESHAAQEVKVAFGRGLLLADDAHLLAFTFRLLLLDHLATLAKEFLLLLLHFPHLLVPFQPRSLLPVHALTSVSQLVPRLRLIEMIGEYLHDDLGVIGVDRGEERVGVELLEDVQEFLHPGLGVDDDDGFEEEVEGDAERTGVLEVDVTASDELYEVAGELY
jgi:hypothetical protein